MYEQFVKLRPLQIVAFVISIILTVISFWLCSGNIAWKNKVENADIYSWNLWEKCIRKATGQFECFKLSFSRSTTDRINDGDAVLVAQVSSVLTIVLQCASIAVQVCGMNCTNLVDVHLKGQKFKNRIYAIAGVLNVLACSLLCFGVITYACNEISAEEQIGAGLFIELVIMVTLGLLGALQCFTVFEGSCSRDGSRRGNGRNDYKYTDYVQSTLAPTTNNYV